MTRITRLVASAALLSALLVLPGTSANAYTVLYRVSSYTGSNFFSALPPAVYPPMTIPTSAPAAAFVFTNGTMPASVQFTGGDLVYDNRFLVPTPPTAFGVFYSSQGWKLNNAAGTLAPNPSATTVTKIPDGFPTLPPFFSSTASQASVALVRVRPGVNKFGGTWDLGHVFDSNQVFATIGGGFRAGNTVSRQLEGISSNTTALAGRFHMTPGFASPQFSSTACPSSPATCPWAGSTTPFQAEATGVRWTTGTVTVRNALPPITLLPPTGTITGMGADNRTGPMSSMGTIQLVSAHNSFGRGALDVGVLNQWDMTLTFVPEPTSTALLGAGALGLFFIHRRRQSCQ